MACYRLDTVCILRFLGAIGLRSPGDGDIGLPAFYGILSGDRLISEVSKTVQLKVARRIGKRASSDLLGKFNVF